MILNASIFLNCEKVKGSKREILFTLQKNATLQVNKEVHFYYGCDVFLFQGGYLELNGGYMNAGSQIRCYKSVILGEGVIIARDVQIWDSDHHNIFNLESCPTKSHDDVGVHISDAVWVGAKSIILKNVTIGEHSVIAAGSTVTRPVPSYCLVGGVPAKIIKQNISWE